MSERPHLRLLILPDESLRARHENSPHAVPMIDTDETARASHWAGWQQDISHHLPSKPAVPAGVPLSPSHINGAIEQVAPAGSQVVLACTATLKLLHASELFVLVDRPAHIGLLKSRCLRLGVADSERGLHFVKPHSLIEVKWRLPQDLDLFSDKGTTMRVFVHKLQNKEHSSSLEALPRTVRQAALGDLGEKGGAASCVTFCCYNDAPPVKITWQAKCWRWLTCGADLSNFQDDSSGRGLLDSTRSTSSTYSPEYTEKEGGRCSIRP